MLSDAMREEPRTSDAQNSTESNDKQIIRILHQMVNLDNERSVRQDHAGKSNLQSLEALRERQEICIASIETVKKQLNDLTALLRSQYRHSDQISLSINPHYMRGARPDSLSMPESVQYAPAVRPDQPLLQGNMQYVPASSLLNLSH